MKKSCSGCKALSCVLLGGLSGVMDYCTLGYKMKHNEDSPSPAENCPKPKTKAEYARLAEERRKNFVTK